MDKHFEQLSELPEAMRWKGREEIFLAVGLP
jgi:hypothetical protein